MRYTVYAAFLGSSSELLEESVLNKLAAKTAPATASADVDPKVHVELLFVPQSKPVKTLQFGHAVYKDKYADAPARKSRFGAEDQTEEVADELTGVACSIHYGGQAFVRENKTFSRANWSFRRIPATPEQARAALEWFKQRQGDGFNKAGFFTEPARRAASRYVSCVPTCSTRRAPCRARPIGGSARSCARRVKGSGHSDGAHAQPTPGAVFPGDTQLHDTRRAGRAAQLAQRHIVLREMQH